MSPWRPEQRRERLALEEPYPDVPSHLVAPLVHFVAVNIGSTVVLALLIVELRLGGYPDPRSGSNAAHRAREMLIEDLRVWPELLLDAVDLLLAISDDYHAKVELKAILEAGNSAYKVREDQRHLEMRVTPGVQQAVQGAVTQSSQTSAGQHLTAAWNAAYGRRGDPVKAYSEAIKAVEAAAIPVVSPNHAKATLGTVRGDLKANLAKWEFVISPANPRSIDTVLAMIDTLWDGQTSRHGGNAPTVPETREQARAAVHLAASLVQWFASGAVRKK